MAVFSQKDYKKSLSKSKEGITSPPTYIEQAPEEPVQEQVVKVRKERIEWIFLFPEFSQGEYANIERTVKLEGRDYTYKVVDNQCATLEEVVANYLRSKGWELMYKGTPRSEL